MAALRLDCLRRALACWMRCADVSSGNGRVQRSLMSGRRAMHQHTPSRLPGDVRREGAQLLASMREAPGFLLWSEEVHRKMLG